MCDSCYALLAARKYDVISLRQCCARGPKQNIFTKKKDYVAPGSTTAEFVNVKEQTNFT